MSDMLMSLGGLGPGLKISLRLINKYGRFWAGRVQTNQFATDRNHLKVKIRNPRIGYDHRRFRLSSSWDFTTINQQRFVTCQS